MNTQWFFNSSLPTETKIKVAIRLYHLFLAAADLKDYSLAIKKEFVDNNFFSLCHHIIDFLDKTRCDYFSGLEKDGKSYNEEDAKLKFEALGKMALLADVNAMFYMGHTFTTGKPGWVYLSKDMDDRPVKIHATQSISKGISIYEAGENEWFFPYAFKLGLIYEYGLHFPQTLLELPNYEMEKDYEHGSSSTPSDSADKKTSCELYRESNNLLDRLSERKRQNENFEQNYSKALTYYLKSAKYLAVNNTLADTESIDKKAFRKSI